MIYNLNDKIQIVMYEYTDKRKWKNISLVYALLDPNTQRVRYIGKSLNGLDRAFYHCKSSSLKVDGNTKKANWIKSLLNKNLKPIVKILYYYNLDIDKKIKNDLIYQVEHKYIKLFKEFDNNLLNETDGGPGAVGRVITEETRLKMSISAKKRGLPEKLKQNQVIKYGPPVPKGFYYKKKPKKGTKEAYLASLKKQIKGVDLTTNDEIYFSSVNDCERHFKSIFNCRKFNRASLRASIKNNKPYYGFYWSFV